MNSFLLSTLALLQIYLGAHAYVETNDSLGRRVRPEVLVVSTSSTAFGGFVGAALNTLSNQLMPPARNVDRVSDLGTTLGIGLTYTAVMVNQLDVTQKHEMYNRAVAVSGGARLETKDYSRLVEQIESDWRLHSILKANTAGGDQEGLDKMFVEAAKPLADGPLAVAFPGNKKALQNDLLTAELLRLRISGRLEGGATAIALERLWQRHQALQTQFGVWVKSEPRAKAEILAHSQETIAQCKQLRAAMDDLLKNKNDLKEHAAPVSNETSSH